MSLVKLNMKKKNYIEKYILTLRDNKIKHHNKPNLEKT